MWRKYLGKSRVEGACDLQMARHDDRMQNSRVDEAVAVFAGMWDSTSVGRVPQDIC
jgi:hypothetical protein